MNEEGIRIMLRYLYKMTRLAEHYEELLDAFDPERSDRIEYENYYNQIDRIWQELDEARELGEENDEILDIWEALHIKACEIYQKIKGI